MKPHSLKIRFLLLCLLILVVVTIFQYSFIIPEMRIDEIDERTRVQESLTNHLAQTIEVTFQQNSNALEEMSRLAGISSMRPESVDRILSEQNSINQFFNYFFVIDAEGHWLSYPSKPHMVGKKVQNDYWVQEVLANNKTTFLDAHVATIRGIVVSGIVTPIYDKDHTIVGFLRGVINLSESNSLLDEINNSHFGTSGFFFLADSKGRLLAHPSLQVLTNTFENTDLSMEKPVQLALDGEKGITEYVYQNETWIASYQPIASTGWVIVSQQPKAEVLMLVDNEIGVFSRIFLVTFGVIILFMLILAHRALTPLSRLLNNISEGNLEKISVSGKDEISRLTHEFERLYKNVLSANKQLGEEITIRKRTEKELLMAKQEADKANVVKTEFLANMSHELRTPLNGILGFTEIVSDTELSKQQQNFVSLINQSAARLLILVNDILDFAKIDAGKLTLERVEFSFRKTVKNVLDGLQHSASAKGLDFTVNMDDEIPDHLLGDPTRLEQILINLVSNAIKFTEKGSVTVSTKLKEKNKSEADLLFTIRDTGIGIEKDKMETIFKAFSQADLSHTRKFGGTGLGLAISTELAAMMGGEIWLESAPSGSTFFFTLRFTHLQSSLPTDHESEKSPGRERQSDSIVNILLAEDEQINSLLAITLIEERGWQVTAVENGKEAVKMWNSGSFDAILMDIQMPEMDGYQATNAIRQAEERSGGYIPIIAMTAHALPGDREKCLDAGMDDYIAKPINQKILYSTIERLINKKNVCQSDSL